MLPKSQISTLVDESGNFSNNPVAAGLRYYFSPRARTELRKEIAAQFRRFHESGLRLSHVDGHLHLHIHPVIFKELLRQANVYGAKRVRVPEEDWHQTIGFNGSGYLQVRVQAAMFRALALYMKRSLRNEGFAFADRVYGNLESGNVNESYFLYALDNLRLENNEIYFHPAVYDEGKSLDADERQHVREYQALVSDKVKQRISELNIALGTYYDLERES